MVNSRNITQALKNDKYEGYVKTQKNIYEVT